VISCGAALYNLRLAIRVAGRKPSVWLLPELDKDSGLLTTVTAQRTLLASIEVMPGRATPPTSAQQELFEALWLRRTDRAPFPYLPVPPAILVEMEIAAAREHGWLRTLSKGQSRQLLRASVRASKDEALQTYLSGLSRVPRHAYGPTPDDQEQPPTRPDFWDPNQVARFERRPQLMTLSTDDDRPLDWLRAGEALQHALLTGTRYSMSALNGRSSSFRGEGRHGTFDQPHLRRLPRVPSGHAVEASFLTQSLERADMGGGRQPRSWPWRTYYPEIPQVAIRVGYAPVERVALPTASADFHSQGDSKVFHHQPE
jgi:hypothetical protein